VWTVGLLALAVLLPLLRQRGTPSWDTIWAEDGYVFCQQALREGGLAVLFRPYAGYLQLVSRLLAIVAPAVPLDWLAAYLAVSATLVGAAVAWFVYWASGGWLTSRPVRLALASLLVLMPALGAENTATITNVIWVTAAAAPWALVSQAERRRDVILRALVCAVAALSTAACVVFVPLALVYPLLRRTRASVVVAAIFLVALAGQAMMVVVVVRGAARASIFQTHVLRIFELMAVRVFAMFLIGDKAITAVWQTHGRLLIGAATVAVLLVFAILFPRAGRKSQALAAAFVGGAILSFAIPVSGRGTTFAAVVLDQQYVSIAMRYSVVPVFLLASAAALLVAPPGPGRDRAVARVARTLFVAHVAVLCWIDFSVVNLRGLSPKWSQALVQARNECAGAAADRPVHLRTVLGVKGIDAPCRTVMSGAK